MTLDPTPNTPATQPPRTPEGDADTQHGDDTAEDIRAYIRRLMATRPEPTLKQIQRVRDLLPPT